MMEKASPTDNRHQGLVALGFNADTGFIVGFIVPRKHVYDTPHPSALWEEGELDAYLRSIIAMNDRNDLVRRRRLAQ